MLRGNRIIFRKAAALSMMSKEERIFHLVIPFLPESEQFCELLRVGFCKVPRFRNVR